ncbi:MAG: hypothetical protein KKA52_02995, partial [Candidatus Omnitrophica bacterium]|nr:hypothetical protein [Candidatus Omnitrophota bacterium]
MKIFFRKLTSIILIQAFLLIGVPFSQGVALPQDMQKTCLAPSIKITNNIVQAGFTRKTLPEAIRENADISILSEKYGREHLGALEGEVIDSIKSADLTQEFLLSELPQADAVQAYFKSANISDNPQDQMNAFKDKVQDAMTLDSFLGNLPLRKALLERGFSLGLTNDVYEALSDDKISGLQTWQQFYDEKGWERIEMVHQHLSELKKHADTEGTPIVFFVPRNIFSHARARVVKEEISWLLNNPDVLKHVIFVFGSAGTQELMDASEFSEQDKKRFLVNVFQGLTGRFEGWISRAAEFKEEQVKAALVDYEVFELPVAETYTSEMEQKLEAWLDNNSEKTTRGKAKLNGDKFQKFYNDTVIKLVDALRKSIDSGQWNEKVWDSYGDYANNYKWDAERSKWNTARKLKQLTQDHKLTRQEERTLKLLLDGDKMIDETISLLVKNIPAQEKEAYVISIHNIGYYTPEYNRTRNPQDQLLAVHDDGSLLDDGYLDGQDLLREEARQRYDGRHKEPGKNSLVKIGVLDFKTDTKEEVGRVLEYFKRNNKQDTLIDPFDKERKKTITFEQLFTDPAYKKVNVFNGFVQSWEKLLSEASRHYEGAALKKQLDFLYGKQEAALASAMVLSNIPSLFKEGLRANTPAGRRAYHEKMNRATNALWRVTNPWESWESALVHNAYDGIGEDQIAKDFKIWRAVLEEFKLRVNRLTIEQAKNISGNLTSLYYEPEKNNTPVTESPEEFYKKMKSKGYHFEGVITSSGAGIADADKEKARDALRRAWQDFDKEKTIIVCGATGNEEVGNLSGVDLVYDVAEEMGFLTMGVMSGKGFDFPLRAVDYLISKGLGWGDESGLLYLFSDGMTGFTGGKQAARELREYIEKVKEDKNKPGHITLIRGIHTYAEEEGSLDAEEVKEKVTAANGTIIEFDAQDRMKVSGWLDALDRIVISMDDIPAELVLLTQKMNDIRDPELKKRINGYRVQLAEEYIRKKIDNTEVRVIVFKYLEDREYTDIKALILNGRHTEKVVNELVNISRFASESLAQSMIRAANGTFDEQRLDWIYDDVMPFTASMLRASPFYNKAEIKKLTGPDYWKDEADWIEERKKQDKRWLVCDANNPEHKKQGEELLQYIHSSLESKLISLLRIVVQKSGVQEEDVLNMSVRTKGADSLFKKIAKFRQTDWGANATIADAVDLLGGRIVVSDFAVLEKITEAIEAEIKQRGGRILRKENKFIANDPLVVKGARPDAYRAIQYIVQFWGADGKQHTFELQLKTFSSMIASDLYHNGVYKPEVLNMPGELRDAITSYTWRSLYEETIKYLRSKNVRIVKKTPVRSKKEQIIRAINERNYNLFFDLVLSKIDADTVMDEEMANFIQDFFNKELEKFETLKELNIDTLLFLARAAHNAYYEEAVKQSVEDSRSDQFGWKLLEKAEEFLKNNLPEGGRFYRDRFENYRGKGGDNKISVDNLQLHKLTDEQLIEFLRLAGKDPDIEKTKAWALVQNIKNLRDSEDTSEQQRQKNKEERDKIKIMNLYHTDFDSQRAMGAEYADASKNPIKNNEARRIWNEKLFVNQLGAVAVAAILTEFGGLDPNGNLRDLSRIVL